MARAVGVLGGAFNPPHLGHVILAQEAVARLRLDELLLVPTGEAPHKRIEPEPGPAVRLALTKAAAAEIERVRCSDIEVAREGPSYAYRTLELLADEIPGSQLTFVMGADAAAGLETWRRPERVLELARIAVAQRPGIEEDAAIDAVDRLGAPHGVEALQMPVIGISSTTVRERVAAGLPIRWLVPDSVAGLIAERGLYREEVAA